MPVIHHLLILKDRNNLSNVKTINFDYVVSFDVNNNECFQDKDSNLIFVLCPLLAYRSFDSKGKESEWLLKNVWVSVQ